MADIGSTSASTRAPRRLRRRLVRAGVGIAVALAVTLAGWAGWSYSRSPRLRDVERKLQRRKYADAERDAQTYLFWHRRDSDALFLLAKARAGLGRLLECARTLERVQDSSPRYPEAQFRAGQAYRQQNRLRDAERAFRACIAADPDGQDFAMSARVELASLLAMEERRGAFRELAWDTYERLPEARRLEVLTMLERLNFEQAKPELNAEPLKAAINADPGDGHARGGLAAALDHQGKVSDALAQYAQAVNDRPDDMELRERYMDLLRRTGDFETLKAVLAAMPAEGADRPAFQNLQGLVAEMRGDFAAAERSYRRAVALNPLEPEYHHRLSLILFRLGKREEASREADARSLLRAAEAKRRQAWNLYANAYDADPSQIPLELLLGMARAIQACGQDREAVAWFRQVLRLDPSEPTARAAIGADPKRSDR